MNTALQPYQEKALDTCDGVIEIAENEMLVRGIYLTGVRDRKKAEEGSICGGRNACLVGSIFLAHGGFQYIDQVSMSANTRASSLLVLPGLRLAYEAINEASLRRAKRISAKEVRGQIADFGSPPEEGWGEWFFETFLIDHTSDFDETRAEVIRVVRHAKQLIKSGVVS